MKKFTAVLLIIGMSMFSSLCAFGDEPVSAQFDVDAVSAVLMDARTGTILYEKNADQGLPPASVTKIMTLLLVMEALDAGNLSLDTMIQASENAASMGGSQIFLKAGEEMTAEDLIKSVVISSANDAAVALAEYVAGSEESFVAKMNERAKELGMTNTSFENTNGLDDSVQNHVSSARDIAIMTKELLKHEKILDYSGTWMDTIRDGAFGLTNTNRLVRFYKGATGLKTGSTSKAKFCISATAQRDGLHLIAVIMASPTRDTRNEAAKKLLDWGFANYSLYSRPEADMGEIKILGGVKNYCSLESISFEKMVSKGDEKKVTEEIVLNSSISAPVKKGDKIGEIILKLDGKEIGSVDICASEDVGKISYFGVLKKMLGYFGLN